MIVVQKYGGSSVANPERIRAVAARIAKRRAEGHDVVAVVSAMGDTTDDLIDLARLNAGTGKQVPDDDGAELVGGRRGEGAVEGTDGSARGAGDDD